MDPYQVGYDNGYRAVQLEQLGLSSNTDADDAIADAANAAEERGALDTSDRLAKDLAHAHGMPQGLTAEQEGKYWLGYYHGRRAARQEASE